METDDGDGKGGNGRRPRRASGDGPQRKGFGPLPESAPRRLELPVRIHYNRSGYAGWNAYMFAVKPPVMSRVFIFLGDACEPPFSVRNRMRPWLLLDRTACRAASCRCKTLR